MTKKSNPQLTSVLERIQTMNQEIDGAVSYLKTRLRNRHHQVLLILGSGLGESLQKLHDKISIPYENIPHFPISTAPGHAGKLVSGRIGKRYVLVMMGRQHMYEGNSLQNIALPIRAAYLMGVRTLVITNACGGLNPTFKEADIMLIRDHINLMGPNALIGPNLDRFGNRFPDIHEPYDKGLLRLMQEVAQAENIPVHTGVFTAIPGPMFETPAEMRMMRILGIDASGMSTIQENIVAKHCTRLGPMKVLGMSIVTDICDPSNPRTLTEEDVIAVAKKAAPKLGKLLTAFLKKID